MLHLLKHQIYHKMRLNFKNFETVFFSAVSIEERTNKKLQQNLVPLIYRTYMSEFLNEPTKNHIKNHILIYDL